MRVRAPGRVNLIGDHTDYTGGLALPMAIDRWTEVDAVAADRIALRSSVEPDPVALTLAQARADEPPPGLPAWGRHVAAVAREVGAATGLVGTITTTIPVGAGLSSSAALGVALALALGFEGDPVALAQLARRAEHRATGVPTGIMDQLCLTSARAGHATLIDCGSLAVTPVPVPDDVAVVVRHVSARTLAGSGYAERVAQCAAAEAVVGPLRTAALADLDAIDDEVVRRRARHVITENQRVLDFAAALAAGDRRAAGEVMVASHHSLRHDYATSTPALDAAVDDLVARPGVYGARVTGGGFGGCVVALCRPDAEVEGWRVSPVAAAARLA